MKWSLRIARIFGIDVFLHFTFLLFLAWIATTSFARSGAAGALLSVGYVLAIFTCVLMHEYGHALAARRYGIGTADITMLPIGGLARLERMPSDPKQELIVALAGPAVNVVIVIALLIWRAVTGAGTPQASGLMTGDFTYDLLRFNLTMIVFNMAPAFPMDGGRVLRALLAMRMPHQKATRIAAGVGQALAVAFGLAGLMNDQMMWVFIALFVWIGASHEAGDAEQRAALSGLKARDAMLTEFRSLSPDHTSRDVARFILEGWQADFPVIEGSECTGIVTRQDVLRVYEQGDPAAPVSAIMLREFRTCGADDDLVSALDSLREASQPIIPVIAAGRVAGLLTTENVMEAMLFRRAVMNRAASPA